MGLPPDSYGNHEPPDTTSIPQEHRLLLCRRPRRVRPGVEPEIDGRRHPRAESSEYRGVCPGSSLVTDLGL